jgi:NADH-quinone oxidoreductase subunit L
MEGPTPVSALIHAATMVAAGVFLIARAYPLFAAHLPGTPPETAALRVVTWVGAVTALFAASIAVAQNDIKRILAYSTVSQLGFMMMGLGAGGVAAGMFHLVTHAFFKALLFLGAGSVIHACHEEQDIRFMGGLRKLMPATFATYAVGMLALSGFPLLFSGFWSKDEILHAAHGWPVSRIPFYLGLAGAFLTAFYMARQVLHVFHGKSRLHSHRSAHATSSGRETSVPKGVYHSHAKSGLTPHESPPVMTVPLILLAVCTLLLSLVGTPAWPWFQAFLSGRPADFHPARIFEAEVMGTMLLSTLVVFAGLGLGWRLYGRRAIGPPPREDALERLRPDVYWLLRRKFLVDEVYERAVVRPVVAAARAADWLDRIVWHGFVQLISYLVLGFAWVNRFVDEYVINPGFDSACRGFKRGGWWMAGWQTGRVQHYLRVIGAALALLVLLLLWGGRAL